MSAAEIATIAAAHEEDCDCLFCLAASGDEDALSAVEVQMALRPIDEQGRGE